MRKTKLVSLLSMMLSIVLIVTLFAGCVKQDKTSDSNKSQDTTESVSSTDKASEDDEISFPLKEKVTYTGFAPMRGEYSIDETFAFQIAAENNINFEITSALESSYKETRDILLAGGEYPDFFINSDVDGELYGAQEGILIPLDDLIRTYAPNLTKMMDERDAWDFLTCTDGHIYTLPAFWDQTPRDGVLWLNEKWLNNLGLKEPTSLEELYQVLKAFKEKDANGNGDPNDEIPFLSMKYNDALPQTLYILLNYFDYRYMAEFKLIVEGDKVRFFPLTDECREALGYFTKLYQEGLVNQDCFTLERDVAKAKARAGDVVGSFIGGSLTDILGYSDNVLNYIAVTPWSDTVELNNSVAKGLLAITDKCKNPELLIAWFDQFYTEEGGILAEMGIEGKTYKVKDNGEWEWYLGNGYGDTVEEIQRYLMKGPHLTPKLRDKLSSDSDPYAVYQREQIRKVTEHGVRPLPDFVFTDDELNEGLPIMIDANGYFAQYFSQVMTGKLDLDSSWDSEFQRTLEAMKAPRLGEILQQVYDRMRNK